MVLPTLSSRFELKRTNFNEDYLKRKYTNQHDRNEQWSNAKSYFDKSNTSAQQYNHWTSDKSYNTSMNAYTRQMSESIEFKEEKRERIKQRQKNLKDFIDKENLELESELKELRLTNGGDDTERSVSRTTNIIETLRTKAENLKQIREEDRKKVAEERLYQHWRLNNPEIRDLDSKKFSDYIVDQWSGQISERNEVVEKERQLDSEYVRYLESEREKAAEKDAELRRLKLSRDLELKEILRQQMIELKQKEAEQEIFEREEYELMQDKYQMDRLDGERKEMEKQHANKEYGRQLLRQHTAKLRKRAKEIQDALEFDLNILKQVASMQESQRNVDESRRAQAKADADYMIRVLNEQLRLEKEREAEIDTMFQDEAAREWEKRNAEWERERLAREKLMNEVLNERKQQIADKFEIIQQKKLESLQQREVLIKDMEQTQMLAQRERDKLERAKVERKQDFQSQLTARKEQIEQEHMEKVTDFEQEQIEQQIYKNFVEKEKEKHVQAKFEPKSFGRKKVAWN